MHCEEAAPRASVSFRVDLSQDAVKNVLKEGLPHSIHMIQDAVRRSDPNLMPPISGSAIRQKVAVCIHIPAAMGDTATDPILLSSSWAQFCPPKDTEEDVVMEEAGTTVKKARKKRSSKIPVLPLVSSRGHMATEIAHDEIKLVLGKLRKRRVDALLTAGQRVQADRFCTEMNALLQALRARSNVLLMKCPDGTVAPGFLAPPLLEAKKPPFMFILYGTGGPHTQTIVVTDEELEFIKALQKYLHPIRFILRNDSLADFQKTTEALLAHIQKTALAFSER